MMMMALNDPLNVSTIVNRHCWFQRCVIVSRCSSEWTVGLIIKISVGGIFLIVGGYDGRRTMEITLFQHGR